MTAGGTISVSRSCPICTQQVNLRPPLPSYSSYIIPLTFLWLIIHLFKCSVAFWAAQQVASVHITSYVKITATLSYDSKGLKISGLLLMGQHRQSTNLIRNPFRRSSRISMCISKYKRLEKSMRDWPILMPKLDHIYWSKWGCPIAFLDLERLHKFTIPQLL